MIQRYGPVETYEGVEMRKDDCAIWIQLPDHLAALECDRCKKYTDLPICPVCEGAALDQRNEDIAVMVNNWLHINTAVSTEKARDIFARIRDFGKVKP